MGRAGGGLLRLLPVVFRFLGFKGTAVVAVGIIGYGLVTGNLGNMLSALGLQQPVTQSSSSQPVKQTAEEKELVQFISVILADTEDTWRQIFSKRGMQYREPKLVLFRGAVKSACGTAQSAMGPFYCPADQKVYIDLGFYDELKNRFKAPGDFAQAYVIAHEIGHHIQTLTGISGRVQAARKNLSEVEGNKLSVKQELQADCLAGVWAYHAHNQRQMLEPGDLEEGLRAASAIGDDNIQKQSRGYVTPDSFTHGSSSQRVKWFRTGFDSGDMQRCDTFAGTVSSRASLPREKNPVTISGAEEILAAFNQRRSDVQVKGYGTVKRVLPDDNDGSRHQKFILSLGNGRSVLVAHNIDLASRLSGLEQGDRVEFYGEYEWNEKGGVLHWTHDDPQGRHVDGWLKHRGKLYQ
jgi:predicted metalloprotease